MSFSCTRHAVNLAGCILREREHAVQANVNACGSPQKRQGQFLLRRQPLEAPQPRHWGGHWPPSCSSHRRSLLLETLVPKILVSTWDLIVWWACLPHNACCQHEQDTACTRVRYCRNVRNIQHLVQCSAGSNDELLVQSRQIPVISRMTHNWCSQDRYQ